VISDYEVAGHESAQNGVSAGFTYACATSNVADAQRAFALRQHLQYINCLQKRLDEASISRPSCGDGQSAASTVAA
jgi:hypothetical protein